MKLFLMNADYGLKGCLYGARSKTASSVKTDLAMPFISRIFHLHVISPNYVLRNEVIYWLNFTL